jgi:hypothetical protein
VSSPTGAPESTCEPPNPQIQPTGRTVPNSARALIADGDQRNEKLFGRGLKSLQLICNSLGDSRGVL